MRMMLGLLLLLSSLAVSAAGPVTHVFIAEKWLKQEALEEQQKRSFILGTLFPDIRYLRVITRAQTHEKGLTREAVQNTANSFKRGMRLHAWVDESRDKYVIKSKIYEKLKGIQGQKFRHTFLKLLEDEILFSEKKWDEVLAFLDTIDKEEQKFEISDENLKKWHRKLESFFKKPSSIVLLNLSKQGRGFANIPPEIVEQWSKELPKYAKREDMKAYVQGLIQWFNKEMGIEVKEI